MSDRPNNSVPQPSLAGRAARKVRAAVAGLTGSGAVRDDLRFLFISGCARSGTNWLGALVNLHPHAVSHGEFKLQWVADGVEKALRNPWNVGHRVPAAGAIMREHLNEMVAGAMVAGIPPRAETKLIADHSPVYFRQMLTPDRASHAVIVRDGRDVLVSWTYHVLRHKRVSFILRPLRPAYEQALASLGDHPKDSPEADAALKAAARTLLLNPDWVARYADDWSRRVTEDKLRLSNLDESRKATTLHVRYEDLHADIEIWRERLYRICHLDPSLAAPVSHETHTAPGFDKERPGRMLRKGQTGDWRNYFTPRTAQAFHARAGTALAAHAYEPDDAWVHSIAKDAGIEGTLEPVILTHDFETPADAEAT